ncbi:MAG: UDP-N-acetylglucosamine--N-acetylmuramyl-(pentapeptide) pyrophosphoryl-undecaprenol N-acetylglucosamine transferase [Anaerolineae bacterium]|nr:UDP-N-acetylglucosamine--N-acetylmuramyl-(pentapeptide) pyrophosphoryl-undecaprenol N-acetylglucosamine transferase [Anaerolineae bacterium]
MSDILISAGGTGGGIYPALAVVEALREIAPTTKLHYVGSIGGMEETLVPRALVDSYQSVYSGPVHSVGIVRLIKSLIKITLGFLQSLLLLLRLRPSALFMTGGFATLPVAAACWLLRVPIVIFLPDIEPALTIRVISRLAKLILTATGDSAQYFRDARKVKEIGYPLRQDLLEATRNEGIRHFGLDRDRPTLLITGGSRGSRSINEAVGAILPELLDDGLQVIHVSGDLDAETVENRREELPADLKRRYHLFSYLYEDMGAAQAAADLVVSRAGASILGEYPYFGLPAILAPLTFAWRYQRTNAEWLTSRGAALVLTDEQMKTELLPIIRELLNDEARLNRMRAASFALRKPDAARQIAAEVLKLAGIINSSAKLPENAGS